MRRMGRLQRFKRYLPAAAFISGFLWDALTLGREIRGLDLLVLGAYAAGAFLILLFAGRTSERIRGARAMNLLLQFFLGGVFSALVILYYTSASDWPALLVVLLLAALLVGNEFVADHSQRVLFSWTFFGISTVMLLNFVIPYLVRSLHPLFFYLSCIAGALLVVALRSLRKEPARSLAVPLGAIAVLAALHFVRAIPPVPLAKKEMAILRSIEKKGNFYRGEILRAPVWNLARFRRPVFPPPASGRLFCFTSVFVPPGVETELVHRWMREEKGEWRTVSSVRFPIRGGRRGGYRGYTYKSRLSEGEWKVVAEAENGRVVGYVRFRVDKDAQASWQRVRL